MGSVVDSLIRLLRVGPHAAATLIDGLDNSLERGLMEVGHDEALASVEPDLVRRRSKVVVGEVLHHIAEDDCVHSIDGRYVEPPFGVLLVAGSRLLPVCELLVVPRSANEETADIVLSGDDKKAVVRVRADASAFFALSVGTVAGWEAVEENKMLAYRPFGVKR